MIAGHWAVSFLLNVRVSPHELRSMMDSAPILTASFTFCNSISKSLQSLEVPRFTLIFVLSLDPIPFGSRQVCSRLAGMTAFPSATSRISSAGSNSSLSATLFSSSVRIPFLAASICVV